LPSAAARATATTKGSKVPTGCGRQTEEWRTEIANRISKVRVIEEVLKIHRDGQVVTPACVATTETTTTKTASTTATAWSAAAMPHMAIAQPRPAPPP